MKPYKIAVMASLAIVSAVTTSALTLNVDTAPNIYGSPLWGPWWAAAKADVVAGTFQNMRSGGSPGSLLARAEEEIVYSTGDLGRRLHWIYWLPGKTKAGLNNLFQVKWVIDWGGENWTYSGGGWALDGAEVGWSQPSRWEDYSGGVIGSLGFAWWATDDDAPPLDTNGNPYDEVDAADISALAAMVYSSQTFARGMVRERDTETGPWTYTELQVEIPEGGTALSLLGLAIAGLGLLGRRIRRS